MQIPRIFQNRSLQLQACFFLTEEASHHVKHVLRMKKDDLLSVFNGQGGEFKAVITQVNKTVEVCLQSFENGLALDLTYMKSIKNYFSASHFPRG